LKRGAWISRDDIKISPLYCPVADSAAEMPTSLSNELQTRAGTAGHVVVGAHPQIFKRGLFL
jgi:hypothetical protein